MNTSNKQKPIAWAVIDSSGNVVELAKTRLSLEHDHIRSDDKIVALYLPTNEELSQNAQKCFDGWKQLADMDDVALESEEAEKIRDELDVYWDKLTEEDMAQLDQKIIDYTSTKNDK